MKKIVTGFALAALLGSATLTMAHGADDNKPGFMKARHGYFQLVGLNFGGLVGMAKGEIAYDAAAASALAGNIQALANMDVSNMFPVGSDNGAMAGMTRAQPNIWTDTAGFQQRFMAFNAAANTMAANAGNGLDAVRAGVGELGASCKGCHENYRAQNF